MAQTKSIGGDAMALSIGVSGRESSSSPASCGDPTCFWATRTCRSSLLLPRCPPSPGVYVRAPAGTVVHRLEPGARPAGVRPRQQPEAGRWRRDACAEGSSRPGPSGLGALRVLGGLLGSARSGSGVSNHEPFKAGLGHWDRDPGPARRVMHPSMYLRIAREQ
nr:unnamed protein product [Digitaria exilis]